MHFNKSFKEIVLLKSLTFSLFLISGIFLQWEFGWLYLNSIGGFGDLLYVLERVDCLPIELSDLYGTRTTDSCTGYIYGSTLLHMLNILGLTQKSLMIAGAVLAISIVLIVNFTVVFSGGHLGYFLLASLLFFSPPVVLLLERANVDAFMALMIFGAAVAHANGRTTISFIFILISALTKFYTFPLLLFPVMNMKGFRRLLFFCVSLLALFYILRDFTRIEAFPWDARNMFGNIIWLEYLLYFFQGPETHSTFFIGSIIGLFLLSLIGFLAVKFKLYPVLNSKSSKLVKSIFNFNLSSFLLCYFSGLSVDYRLFFLLVAGISSLHLFHFSKIQLAFYIGGLSLSFYLSYNSGNAQPLGDLCLIVVICQLILGLFFSNISFFGNKSN